MDPLEKAVVQKRIASYMDRCEELKKFLKTTPPTPVNLPSVPKNVVESSPKPEIIVPKENPTSEASLALEKQQILERLNEIQKQKSNLQQRELKLQQLKSEIEQDKQDLLELELEDQHITS